MEHKHKTKVISILTVLIIVVELFLPVVSRAEDTVAIKFNDENMYKSMVKQLGSKVTSEDDDTYTINITQANIDSVESIGLSSFNITTSSPIQDITGIEHFKNLKNLRVIWQ